MITYFQNKYGKNGVVVDPLDKNQLKNRKRKSAPEYNHLEGKRTKNFYQDLDSTGPIDPNGKPIKNDDNDKITSDPGQIHGDSSTVDENA